MKQDKKDKLTTQFNPVPHTVIQKTGNSVVVEAPSGATYSRNTSHVKKFHNNDNNDTTNLEPSVPRKTNDIGQELAEPVTPVPIPTDPTPPTRPQRCGTYLKNSKTIYIKRVRSQGYSCTDKTFNS